MTAPPSTFMAWPVMFRASSEARLATRLAISSEDWGRPRGVTAFTRSWKISSMLLSVGQPLKIVLQPLGKLFPGRRPDISGTDRIDRDQISSELFGHNLGQSYDCELRCTVGADQGLPRLPHDGGDVDDPPFPPLHHVLCRCTGAKEGALQIDILKRSRMSRRKGAWHRFNMSLDTRGSYGYHSI